MELINKKKVSEGGWILKWSVIFVALVLGLSYLGFDLETFMGSEQTTSNLDYIKDSIYNFWTNYGREYFNLFYEHTKVIIDPILEALRNPGSVTLESSMPKFNAIPTIK